MINLTEVTHLTGSAGIPWVEKELDPALEIARGLGLARHATSLLQATYSELVDQIGGSEPVIS